jgi:hypothetical protein
MDKNAFAAYEFLLRTTGGDAGAAKFVEATTKLSDAELCTILDEVVLKKKKAGNSKKTSARGENLASHIIYRSHSDFWP